MATNGLLESAMAVYNAALGTTHLKVAEDRPQCLAGFRTHIFGDAAAYRLGTTGKATFDWKINALEGNKLKRINPGGTRTLSRTDNIDSISQRVVLFYQDFAVVDAEIERDEGMMMLLEAGRLDMFVEKLFDVRKAKKEEQTVTLGNEMDRSCSAVPNYDEMENRSNTPEQTYSLFAMINEDYLGHYGVVTSGGFAGAGSAGTDHNTEVEANGGTWDTKQGLSLATAAQRARFTVNGVNVMAPRKFTYTTIDKAVTSHFTALVKAVRETNYKRPWSVPGMESYISAPNNVDRVFYQSSMGADVIQASTLSTQDLWVAPSRKDPAVMNPLISGVPLEEWEGMTNAAIYDGGTVATTKVTEGQGTRKGPRWILHSRSTLFPVAHKLNWFRTRKAAGNQLIPDLIGEYVDVEWTWACIDFRNQAIIAPSASVSALGTY